MQEIPTPNVQDQQFIVPPAPLPWYERLLPAPKYRKRIGLLFIVVMFVLFNLFIARQIKTPQIYKSHASEHSAVLSIKPNQQQLPPKKSVQLWVTPDAPVAFVHVELTFDPTKMKITADPSIRNPLMSRIVVRTPFAQANTTGRIALAIGLDPTKRDTPLASAFELASIEFEATTTESLTTSIQIDPQRVEVVHPDMSIFAVRSQGAVMMLNPIPPTPTLAPTPIRTPTPISCTPQNGTWTYGEWSECTAQCGTGLQFRTAECTGSSCGGTCTDTAEKRRECNTNSCSSTVKIFAAGTKAGGVYPAMSLVINGKQVAQWSDIRGNTALRVFNTYVYTSPVPLTNAVIRVRYINDKKIGREDRNLQIDKIMVNDVSYETEAPSIYTVGTWNRTTGCKAGNKQSEWIHCPGYVQFQIL